MNDVKKNYEKPTFEIISLEENIILSSAEINFHDLEGSENE